MPMGEKEGAKARSCFLSSNGWKYHKKPHSWSQSEAFLLPRGAGNDFFTKIHLSLMKGSLSKRKAPQWAENTTLVPPSQNQLDSKG